MLAFRGGVKRRSEGNRRRPRAGVIRSQCKYTPGHLACKWVRTCHVRNEFPWIRAFCLVSYLKAIRVNQDYIASVVTVAKAVPKLSESKDATPFNHPHKRKLNKSYSVEVPWTMHLLPSVVSSEFCPKCTSVWSGPLAHWPPSSSSNIESSEVNRRWPCQKNWLDPQIRNPISIFDQPDNRVFPNTYWA